MQSHRGTRGEGEVDGTSSPPPWVLISCSISKRFCLQWKAFDLLYKMRCILWVVTLLEVCEKRITTQVKKSENLFNNFLLLTCKVTHK